MIVCITQDKSRDNYLSLLSTSQQSIINFKIVKNSFIGLKKLSKELAIKEDSFATYGVDVVNNQAEICLPNEDKVNLYNLSNSNANMPVIYKYKEKATKAAALAGGYLIQGSLNFTMSACGIYNGSPAILFCGHSNTLGQTIYYNGSAIGPVVYRRLSNGYIGDYSIVDVSDSSPHWTTAYIYTSYLRTNIGNVTYPAIGTTIRKYGQTTGNSIGTLVGVDIGVFLEPGLTIEGMSRGSNGFNAESGDSGGPIYTVPASYKCKYVGVFSCFASNGDGTEDVFFTPYHYIPFAANVG